MPRKKPEKTIIANMGLFWDRRKVRWRGNKRVGSRCLLGVRKGAKRTGQVDFWPQAGIYVPYTSDYKLVYVGQAGLGDASCIGSRLLSHTRDDLAGRWDIFSWFGLRRVNLNNTLGGKFKLAQTTNRILANVLEGVVIEVAEPPMNSQKGRFGPRVVRYLQALPDEFEEEGRILKQMDKRSSNIEKVLARNR
jgi:hypothetical protein